ncbi:MAG TPA: nucleoside deaminase [Gemmatimonadales bacterium]|jgi:tRNA(Arg) A34 adenosine deaminase TadA
MNQPDSVRSLQITLPDWLDDIVDWRREYGSLEARMEVAVTVARENVLRGTGGPFGAAVFETDSGRLVSVGVNSVTRLNNSALHAEVLALMLAQQRVGCFSLSANNQPKHELVTSCEPCAMCLGATLWSGVRRLVCGASRADATALSFDEGPVFPESWSYLQRCGVEVIRDVMRPVAAEVLELYRNLGGPIYNA